MSEISNNKFWIKESDTLYIFLVSFIDGVYCHVSQFHISLIALRRDNIIHRFFNREFVPLLYTFFKKYIKKKNDSCKKAFSGTKEWNEGIKALPADTFWVNFAKGGIVKKCSVFATDGSYAITGTFDAYTVVITTNPTVVGLVMPTNRKLSSGSG